MNLTLEERKVLRYFQEKKTPLLAATIAEETGLDDNEVMDAFSSLSEKGFLILEDKTAGELSSLGMTHNLFEDESIDELSGLICPEAEIILRYFTNDPKGEVSIRALKAFDGLADEEIERGIEDLDRWGYPIKTRMRP